MGRALGVLSTPFAGGGERTRTADFYVANVALYQLSYTPEGTPSLGLARCTRFGHADPRNPQIQVPRRPERRGRPTQASAQWVLCSRTRMASPVSSSSTSKTSS